MHIQLQGHMLNDSQKPRVHNAIVHSDSHRQQGTLVTLSVEDHLASANKNQIKLIMQ